MVTRPIPITIGRQRAPAAGRSPRGLARSAVTTLVVLDDQTGQPAGIITDTDVAHVVADGKDVNNVRISDAMTRDPAFVDAATSLQEVAELIRSGTYRRAGRRRLRSRRDRRDHRRLRRSPRPPGPGDPSVSRVDLWLSQPTT